MNTPIQNNSAKPALGMGKIAFITILFAAGFVLLAWTGARALDPPIPKPDVAQDAKAFLRTQKTAALSEPLEKLLSESKNSLVKSQIHPLLGRAAPEFQLPDCFLMARRLSAQVARGSVELVFYYGYRCNHCVSQLFDIQEDLALFRELGCEVIAISADPPDLTGLRFKQYGEFTYPVLSDKDNQIAKVYGVFKPAEGIEKAVQLHGTFVIGRDGIVHWAQSGNEPFTGNRTLLYEVARLEGRLPKEEATR